MELFQPREETASASPEGEATGNSRMRKLLADLRNTRGELDAALDQLDELAAALGACEACWGEDKRCPDCRGKGSAGYFEPDRALFDRYIMPALKNTPWLSIAQIETIEQPK